MHLEKSHLIFRGKSSIENRYQAGGSVWREKPLKFLLVTKDLRLARELTRDLETHMALSAANYPSFFALERSLPAGTDLLALDEAAYADYTRLASQTLRDRIGEAPVVVITAAKTLGLPQTGNVTVVERGAAPQLIGTLLAGIHQHQETLAASARQELLN